MANEKQKMPPMRAGFSFMWFWGFVLLLIVGYTLFGEREQRPIDGDWNLTFTLYNSDTITMNNHLYYYVEPKQIESVPGYVTYNYSVETIYFREDRQNGRLYLYVKNNYVEKEMLLCDMSLNVGDTFSIPTYQGSSYEIKVRNIRMVSGIKTIEFGELHTETLLIENMM